MPAPANTGARHAPQRPGERIQQPDGNAIPVNFEDPVNLLRDSVLSPATVRRAGEILTHARVEIAPGAPHSMYWETPSLFDGAVSRFLADVTAAGVTRG
jgi:pimeloyl-ACP methyl ester carboxylesterase